VTQLSDRSSELYFSCASQPRFLVYPTSIHIANGYFLAIALTLVTNV
jgi:hypothetical protein